MKTKKLAKKLNPAIWFLITILVTLIVTNVVNYVMVNNWLNPNPKLKINCLKEEGGLLSILYRNTGQEEAYNLRMNIFISPPQPVCAIILHQGAGYFWEDVETPYYNQSGWYRIPLITEGYQYKKMLKRESLPPNMKEDELYQIRCTPPIKYKVRIWAANAKSKEVECK